MADEVRTDVEEMEKVTKKKVKKEKKQKEKKEGKEKKKGKKKKRENKETKPIVTDDDISHDINEVDTMDSHEDDDDIRNKKERKSPSIKKEEISTAVEDKDNALTKKEKKRKRKEENGEKDEEKKAKKKKSSEDRRAKKEEKKLQKQLLMEKVPKVDEHGIAYTKLQIRRMMRRVKNGLPAVLTEAEENERNRQIRLEKKQEEDELADMLYERENIDNDEEKEDSDVDADDYIKEENQVEEKVTNEDEQKKMKCVVTEENSKNKKKRSKPVPDDYVCWACKDNPILPRHWIYDCPNKIYQPGTNQISKRQRGINDPSAKKLFVSGLPFEINVPKLSHYFITTIKINTNRNIGVQNIKLLTFEDSKRCKGQAFVTFDTEDAAKSALQLNGTMVDWNLADEDDQTRKKKKKKGASGEPEKQKKLRLSVSKVRARNSSQKNWNNDS